MPLHTAIFGVLIVASIEAAIWFAAYESINITEHPYCCPFPPVVVAALVMQVKFVQSYCLKYMLFAFPLTIMWCAVLGIMWYCVVLCGIADIQTDFVKNTFARCFVRYDF